MPLLATVEVQEAVAWEVVAVSESEAGSDAAVRVEQADPDAQPVRWPEVIRQTMRQLWG